MPLPAQVTSGHRARASQHQVCTRFTHDHSYKCVRTHGYHTCVLPGQDAARLADQVAGLTEELGAMHAAWAERDVKQRLQDLEMKELGHQVS